MTNEQAWKILGNQPKWAIQNMIHALESMSALNTPEDNERLDAAKVVRRHGYKNPRYN